MIRRLLWLAGWVTHNFGWKMMALAIAVVIWALVATEPELSTFATVRLEFRNLPDDLEVSSAPVSSVSLELRGPSGELRSMAGETQGPGGVRPEVVLDMSGVQPGERTYAIGDGNVRLPRGVRLVRATPSEVRLDFERRGVREVPVVPRFAGDGTNGYAVARFDVQPPRLLVAGPASHVDRIRSVTTDPVDVSAAVGSSEFHVNAFVADPFVRFQGSPQVTVAVTMQKR